MLATTALALALAAGSPAVQPAEEGTILRRAHDDSGMGFGPVSRTPSEFPEEGIAAAAQPQEEPGGAGYGSYYQWNPTTEQWDVHYDYHTSRYQYGPAPTVQPGAPAMAEQPAISGTIEDLRTTILYPQRRPVALASVRLRDGTAQYVSLGRADDISRLRLRRGEFITVRGRQNFVDGQPVFMATGLAVDGREFPITQPADIARQNPQGPRPRLDPQTQPTRWRQQPVRRTGEATRWEEEEWDTTRGRPFSSPVSAAMPTGRTIEVPRTARAGGWDQADTGQWRTDELIPPTTGVGQGVAGERHLLPAGYNPDEHNVRWRATESGMGQAPVSDASQLAGRVQEIYYTNVPGMHEEELVVRLTVSGVPGRLVSLGTGLTPYQLDELETARSIEVRGRTVDIGGYPVLLAERITADGSTYGVRHGGN